MRSFGCFVFCVFCVSIECVTRLSFHFLLSSFVVCVFQPFVVSVSQVKVVCLRLIVVCCVCFALFVFGDICVCVSLCE